MQCDNRANGHPAVPCSDYTPAFLSLCAVDGVVYASDREAAFVTRLDRAGTGAEQPDSGLTETLRAGGNVSDFTSRLSTSVP